MLLFPVFPTRHFCLRSEWRLTISVTPKRCRRLAAVMKKTIRCHPKRMWKICYRNEESGKMSFKVIDSSLGVMLLFPVFPTRHSCYRSEWRLTISVTLKRCRRLAAVMKKTIRRHPERQRRIYDRGEESGKKIKAISCELSAMSCQL